MTVELSWSSVGDGPPLVMIHGGLVDSRSWQMQADLGSSMRLVMPDTRGFGRSWPAEPPRSLDDLVADVIDVLDRAQIGSAHLLGFSIGGMIAQTVALRCPDRVHGLVLAGTRAANRRRSPEVGAPKLGVGRERPQAGTIADHVARAFSARFRDDHPEFLADYGTMAAENHARGFTSKLISVLGEAPTLDELESLDCRTTVLHGTDDAAIPFAHGEELAERIPRAELVSFAACGHSIHIEARDRFNRELRRVVRS